MQTPKQIMLELLKPDGHPERLLKQYEGLHLCLYDPINAFLRGNRKRGTRSVDCWGVTIDFPEDAPGAIPVHNNELTVCKDITKWRETVKAPDLAASCTTGWEECEAKARETAGDEKLFAVFMGTGIFEQCHFLMGFEDTLTNLYEHPQEMHELIEYILEYRMQYVKLLIDKLHPDVVFTHDDWGTKNALFMKPETWREFFKEPYRKFYGYIRERGCIAIHHADSYLVPIIEDMVELGIQCWQGTLPENDIPALQEQLQGRMILMGGLGAAIDRVDATPEQVLSYANEQIKKYAPGGHYIPCITYGVPGTVFPQVNPYLDAAIDEYNNMLHMPHFTLPPVPKRIIRKAEVQAKADTTLQVEAEQTLLQQISTSLYKGQQKKLLSLCQEALTQGYTAQNILSDGLVRGMNIIGDDFSASKVFVPEMLIAARCMSAATAYLKPYMTDASGNSATLGKACLGTVKGDMHDIGKNLVKIMLEGSGIEVIDLGADVPAEKFIESAIENKCDLICCSALLTTTMEQMRTIVTLAKEKGIRDQVKIFVGGAPITQDFCNDICADIYADDAGQAARLAVEILKSAS